MGKSIRSGGKERRWSSAFIPRGPRLKNRSGWFFGKRKRENPGDGMTALTVSTHLHRIESVGGHAATGGGKRDESRYFGGVWHPANVNAIFLRAAEFRKPRASGTHRSARMSSENFSHFQFR